MKITSIASKAVGGVAVCLAPALGWATATDIEPATRDFGRTPHDHFDYVLNHVFVDITVIGVIFTIVALYLMFAYKRKSPNQVGKLPKLTPQAALGWVIIPSAIFLADDIYLFALGWDLHDHYRKVPADAYEVKVTGQLWQWSYQYPNGVESYNELIVPVGKPVLLRMTSNDVLHSHYMQAYRVTEDVMPGRVTYQWFMPDKVGESVVTCREYCGLNHSNMYGTVKVVTQAEFDSWMTQQQASLEQDSAVRATAMAPLTANNGV